MAIGIEVYAWLNERKIRRDTDNLANQLERDASKMGSRMGSAMGDSMSRSITASSAKAGRAFNAVESATKRAEAAQQRYNASLKTGDTDRITRATDNYARALGRQADAQRNAASSLRSLNQSMNEAGSAGKNLNKVVQDIGDTAFRTGRGLTTIGAPAAIAGLLEIGKVGLAATQALWLLPAAATAAGAGIGTLKLATAGFSDTIKDIRDPEKFAETIQALSPAAQQAALTIRELLPQFDALKNATQDSFFAGMGEQINRLSTQYLPSIQNLTTSIATSFNSMLTGVANQLMTADTQASMQQTFDNISLAFQNAAPAAQSFAGALGDIIAVGSQSLPGMGQSIAEAAANFADFIREARESGQLATWIQQGVDAIQALAGFVWDLGQLIYRVFGPDAGASIDSFNQKLGTISEVIGLVMLDGQTWSASWKQELDSMHGPIGGIRDAIMDIPEAFAWVVNKGIDFVNLLKRNVIDKMGENFTNFMNIFNPGDDKVFKPLDDISRIDTGWANDWGGHDMPTPINQPYGPGNAGDRQRERRGTQRPQPGGQPGAPWGGPYAVPAPPPPGGKPSDRERRDAIIAGLPESAWKVNPYEGIPGATAGATNGMPHGPGGKTAVGGIYQGYNEFGQPIGPGGNVVDPQKIDDANWNVLNTAHDVEEARKELLALQADNEATAEQINDARWRVTETERSWHKAQRELVDAQNGTFKELEKSTSGLTEGMGEIGAALDKDLGISKGLAGMADNLVRFVASLAAAPMLGKLAAVQNADPRKGGHGLLGIAGAQGAFGPDFTGLDTSATATTGGSTSPSAYTPTTPSSSPVSTAGIPASQFSDAGLTPAAAQLNDIVASYFPAVQDIGGYREDPHPDHPSGRALDIMIPGGTTRGGKNPEGKALGDQMWEFLTGNGLIDPQGSLWQTDTGGDHYDHIHARIAEGMEQGLPGFLQAPGSAMATTGGSTAFSGGGTTPVFVTNWPGGGGGAGLPTGGGAAGGPSIGGRVGQGTGIPGIQGGSGGALANSLYQDANGAWHSRMPGWEHLIQRESSGINQKQGITDINSGGNEAEGLFQITPQTWAGHGGTKYAPSALSATPQQQAEIAQAIFNANPTGRDWGMGLSGRENPAQLHSELQSTAATTGGSTSLPSLASLGPTGGSVLPGAGMPQSGMPGGRQYGGIAPAAPNPGGGGAGMTPGGTLETAMNLGAGALDVMAPGAGQAAATGMKLANRAIQYAGQVAGIGVSGLMETFLPTGASELANNSWFTRIVGGLAGAAPALPNIAGGKSGKEEPPLSPADVLQQNVNAKAGTHIDKLEYNNNGATEDRAGKDLTYHLERSAAPPGPR